MFRLLFYPTGRTPTHACKAADPGPFDEFAGFRRFSHSGIVAHFGRRPLVPRPCILALNGEFQVGAGVLPVLEPTPVVTCVVPAQGCRHSQDRQLVRHPPRSGRDSKELQIADNLGGAAGICSVIMVGAGIDRPRGGMGRTMRIGKHAGRFFHCWNPKGRHDRVAFRVGPRARRSNVHAQGGACF